MCFIFQKNSSIYRHKGYGFIEYENINSTTDAIATMNLFDLGGQLLRVGRAITPPDGLLLGAAGVGLPAPSSTTTAPAVGSKLPRECAVAAANITAQLQAIDIVECPVGNIGAMNAQKMLNEAGIPFRKSPTPSRSQQQSSNKEVVEGENPASSVNTSPKDHASTVAPISSFTDDQLKILGVTGDDAIRPLGDEPSIRGKEQRQLLMRKLIESRSSSCVLLLTNLVDPDGVDDELEDDIKDECSKYGQIKRVVITEQADESENNGTHIRVFVEFANADVIEEAIRGLNGRFFGGRVVNARVYDQNLFNNGYYAAS